MEILSIILGVLLLLGIMFMPKTAYNDLKDDRLKIIFAGGRVVRIILIPLIAVALVGFGIYLFIDNRAEIRKKEKIEAERLEQYNNEEKRKMRISKLEKLINSPQHERENLILSMDFEPGGQNDWGHYYTRDYDSESIQKWDDGTIRYITNKKENYVFLKGTLDSLGFEFISDSKNESGDVFYKFQKDSVHLNAGIFSDSKEYLIAIWNPFKAIAVKPFLANNDFIGDWGRNGEIDGTFEIKSDGTFRFKDSEQGLISGTWVIDSKKVSFNYGRAKDSRFPYISQPHRLNQKTEILYIERKGSDQISGQVSGATFNSNIILSRR